MTKTTEKTTEKTTDDIVNEFLGTGTGQGTGLGLNNPNDYFVQGDNIIPEGMEGKQRGAKRIGRKEGCKQEEEKTLTFSPTLRTYPS